MRLVGRLVGWRKTFARTSRHFEATHTLRVCKHSRSRARARALKSRQALCWFFLTSFFLSFFFYFWGGRGTHSHRARRLFVLTSKICLTLALPIGLFRGFSILWRSQWIVRIGLRFFEHQYIIYMVTVYLILWNCFGTIENKNIVRKMYSKYREHY